VRADRHEREHPRPRQAAAATPAVQTSAGRRDIPAVLLRDELANLGWTVERTVEGPAGQQIDRAQAFHIQVPSGPPAAALAYRLVEGRPLRYWFPLVPRPVSDGGSASLRLVHEKIVGAAHGDSPGTPAGRLLAPDPLRLYDEEIPRDGARVTRSYRLARWTDGSTCLWAGPAKQPGRGETSTGPGCDSPQSPPPWGSTR
jgi:hypothetical protein